jgi:hypothetical protein
MDENTPKQVSYQEFSKRYKEKYPAYKDVDDRELAQAIIEKTPEYAPHVNFNAPDPIAATSPSAQAEDTRNQKLAEFDTPYQDLIAEHQKIEESIRNRPRPVAGVGGVNVAAAQDEQVMNSWKRKPEWDKYATERKKFEDKLFVPSIPVEDIDKKLAELNEQYHKSATSQTWGDKKPSSSFEMAKMGVPPQNVEGDKKRTRLQQSISLLESAKKLYDPKTEAKGMAAIGAAIKSGAAEDFASMGIAELLRTADVAGIANAKRDGQEISPEDESVLEAYGILSEMEGNPNKSLTYDVTKGVKDMIPYMIQFAMTGGANDVVQDGLRALMKISARKGATIAAADATTVGAKAALGKVAAYAAGAAAQAPLLPMGPTNFAERITGDITPEGELVAGSEEQPLEAFYKSGATVYSEVFTEGLGEMFGKPFTFLAKGSKAAGKVLNPVEKFAKAAKFDGWLAEYGEEFINSGMQSVLTGDQTLKEAYDPRNQLVTFLTVAAVGGATYGLSKAANVVDQKILDSKLNVLPEDLREKVRGLTDAENPELIANDIIDIFESQKLTPEQEEGILNYTIRTIARKADYKGTQAQDVTDAINEQSAKVAQQKDAIRRTDEFVNYAAHKTDGMVTQVEDSEGKLWWVKDGDINNITADKPLALLDNDGNTILSIDGKGLVIVKQGTAQELRQQTLTGLGAQTAVANQKPQDITGLVNGDDILVDGTPGWKVTANIPGDGVTVMRENEDGSQEVDHIEIPDLARISRPGQQAGQEPGQQAQQPGNGISGQAPAPAERRTVIIGKSKVDFLKQPDGAYHVDKSYTTEKAAKTAAETLEGNFKKLQFEVIDLTDQDDELAVNNFRIIAKPRVAAPVTSDNSDTSAIVTNENPAPAPVVPETPAAPDTQLDKILKAPLSETLPVPEQGPADSGAAPAAPGVSPTTVPESEVTATPVEQKPEENPVFTKEQAERQALTESVQLNQRIMTALREKNDALKESLLQREKLLKSNPAEYWRTLPDHEDISATGDLARRQVVVDMQNYHEPQRQYQEINKREVELYDTLLADVRENKRNNRPLLDQLTRKRTLLMDDPDTYWKDEQANPLKFHEKFGYIERTENQKRALELIAEKASKKPESPAVGDKPETPDPVPPEAAPATAPAPQQSPQKEPWQMTRAEFDSYTKAIKDEYDKVFQSQIKGTGFENDSSTPVHKEISNRVFNEFKRRYPFLQNFMDLDGWGRKRIIQQAIYEGKPVSPEVLAEFPDLGKNKSKPVTGEPTYEQKKNIVLDYFGGMYEDVVKSSPFYIWERIPEVTEDEAKMIYQEIKDEFEAEQRKLADPDGFAGETLAAKPEPPANPKVFIPANPVEERAAGYRIVNGEKIFRQEPIEKKAEGSDNQISFTGDVVQPGKWTIVEASSLQSSHVQQSRNPLHFISEAQPKERTDKASDLAAEKIADNLDPEKITTKTTNAYFGAPTVNSRGEVIQGNNRIAGLKRYWSKYPRDDKGYRKYLKKISAEIGIDPLDSDRFVNPVLVNMVDVTDDEAIVLGQYNAEELETGGKARIKAKETVRKAGNKLPRLIEILIQNESGKDEAIKESIRRNGVEALRYMHQNGLINDTQLQAAIKPDGRSLRKEAVEDLENVILFNVFDGARADLSNIFESMRYAAQSAVIKNAGIIEAQGLKEDIRSAIEAWSEFDGSGFRDQKVDGVGNWSRQFDMFLGGTPSQRYSPQTLKFVELFVTLEQKVLTNLFKKLELLTKGDDSIFAVPPIPFEEAFKQTFGVDYDTTKRGGIEANSGADKSTPDSGRNKDIPEGSPGTQIGAGPVGETGGNGLRPGEPGSSKEPVSKPVPGPVQPGLDDLAGNTLAAARKNSTLDKRANYPGYGTLTRREFVEKAIKDGLVFKQSIYANYPGDSGRQKIKEDQIAKFEKDGFKVKTVYTVNWPGGTLVDVTKAEFDYSKEIGQQPAANQPEPSPIPDFKTITLDEYNQFMQEKAKEYGSKDKFLASQEYSLINIKVNHALRRFAEEAKQEQDKRDDELRKVFAESGLKVGDRVQYAVGPGPGMGLLIQGTIAMRDNVPIVKTDVPINGGAKSMRWHKGWMPIEQDDAPANKPAIDTKGISTTAAKYGWTVKENNGKVELINRNGKHAADLTENKGKYSITYPDGSKILTGNKSASDAVDTVIREVFYGKEVQEAKVDFKEYLSTLPTGTIIRVTRKEFDNSRKSDDFELKEQDEYSSREGYPLDNKGKRKITGGREYFTPIPTTSDVVSIDVVGTSPNTSKLPPAPAPTARPTTWGNENKTFTEDAAARARAILKAKRNNMSSGIDPEYMMAAIQLAGYHIEAGARKFADFVKVMVEDVGEEIRPYLKSLYESIRTWPGFKVTGLDTQEFVGNFDVENFNTESDVYNRPADSEPDSQDAANGQLQNDGSVSNDGRQGSGSGTKTPESNSEGDRGPAGSESGSGLFAPDPGESGDHKLYPDGEKPAAPSNDAGGFDGRGSSIGGLFGVPNRPGANQDGGKGAPKATTSFLEQVRINFKKQQQAESSSVVVADAENIRETLPFLLREQQDDVLKAETRFNSQEHKTKERANGKGMLFTNGTGTGKTYVGLGLIKRFAKQGKNNILIVVPTQPKVDDWIKDGANLLLNITALNDTKTAGKGINITTYANFRANTELLNRDFDLVVYDESHRLMEEKNGQASATTETHYKVSNRSPEAALRRLQDVDPLFVEERSLRTRIREQAKGMNNLDLMEWDYFDRKEKLDKMEARLAVVQQKQKEEGPKLEERAQKAYQNTKVVFLSATPFKSHFNLRYANGLLFDWSGETTYQGSSRVDPESRFFLDNFGSAYEWRYHRLQSKGNANADAIAMQEVQFAEKMMKDGVMSGRAIESNQDYAREFPRVAGLNTEDINRAFSDIYNYQTNLYDGLRDAARKVFYDYNYTTQLFESLRTSVSIPRIQKHLELGRKVVVFHRRKQANASPPFAEVLRISTINATSVLNSEDSSPKQKDEAEKVLQQVADFQENYSGVLEYEKTLNYDSAIDQIKAAFGERVVLLNGDITSKKVKSENIRKFNEDGSGVDIIVIQEESGKEGISLHDKSGQHQRVLMSMSMPISSITALQIEGRIFRIGQETDAIFEYPIIGLDMEIAHFGSNINKKLSTTENLAVGDQSRDLIRSFAEGVLFNEGEKDPHSEQGKGGKEYDKKVQQSLSEFRKAVLVYSTNQRNRARRSDREGVDYFATPEPVGQKMVEWLNLTAGDMGLEPSAGHGAIAMWFQNFVNVTAIEPSFALYSKLNARSGGGDRKILNSTFEDFHITNKFEGVAMNPPFGSGGKTAMDHLEKAFKHLRNGGRVVAIIPNGGSMDKRLEKFLYGEDENGKSLNPEAYLVADIKLPGVTFVQAGTSVSSRIVIIDKHYIPLENGQPARNIDLSDAETIDELFDRIEDISIPDRVVPNGPSTKPVFAEPKTDSESGSVSSIEGFDIFQQTNTRTGNVMYMVRAKEYLGDDYGRINRIVKSFGGKYSSYVSRVDNIRNGFEFKTAEARRNFIEAISPNNTLERKSGIGEAPKMVLSKDKRLPKQAGMKTQAVNGIVDELNSRVNSKSKAIVVETAYDLPRDYVLSRRFDSEVTGLNHKGQAYIVAENCTDQDEVIATWVHEVGVHSGLRSLITDTLVFERLMKSVWVNANRIAMSGNKEYKDIIKFINSAYNQNGPDNSEVRKGEEFLAFLGEKIIRKEDLTPAERSIWQDFVSKVRDILSGIFGFTGSKLSERDIADIIKTAVQSTFTDPTTDKTGRDAEDFSFAGEKLNAIRPPKIYDRSKEKAKNKARKEWHWDSLNRKPMNEAFKKWFGKSKIVNPDGSPMVLYHGSPNGGFTEFSKDHRGTGADNEFGYGDWGNGFYFTPDEDTAQEYADADGDSPNPQVYSVYLKMDNPLDLRKVGQVQRSITDYLRENNVSILSVTQEQLNSIIEAAGISVEDYEYMTDLESDMGDNWGDWDFADKLQQDGYDGIINADGSEYVAFEPTQIKSATDNTGEFNQEDPDIRMRLSPAKAEPTNSPAFKAWFKDSKVVDENGKPLVVYHGSPYGEITTFDKTELVNASEAFFFTGDKSIAEHFTKQPIGEDSVRVPGITAVYLSLRNPVTYKGNVENIVTIDQLFEGMGLQASDVPGDLVDYTGQDEAAVWKWYTEEPGVFGKLREMGYDGFIAKERGANVFAAFSPNQIKSATGNNGNFDPLNDSILARKKKPAAPATTEDEFAGNNLRPGTPAATAETGQWKPSMKPLSLSWKDRKIEQIQDNDIAVLRFQEEIKRLGGTVSRFAELHDAIPRFRGKNRTMIEDYNRDFGKPVLSAVVNIQKAAKKSYTQVSDYIYAKHAIERNEEMNKANNGPDRDNWAGMTSEEATNIVQKFEKDVPAALTEALHKSIKAATNFTLKTWRDTGIISPEEYQKYMDRYKNYVPLRGWNDGQADEVFRYIDKDLDHAFNPNKQAKGRRSKADDPIPYIFSMGHSAVVSGNKNLIKQRLLNIARKNYKDMPQVVTFNKLYEVLGPDGTWTERSIRPKQELFDAKLVRVKQNKSYKQRASSSEAGQHEVEVWENGDKYIVLVDPQVANAINGNDVQLSEAMQKVAAFTRFWSALTTSQNPAFVIPNMARDFGFGARQVGALYGLKGVNDFRKNYKEASKAVWRAVNEKDDPAHLTADAKYRHWREMGGPTGYVHLQKLDALKKEIARDIDELKRIGERKNVQDYLKRARNLESKLINRLAEFSELTGRYAAYLTALQNGASEDQATTFSKEITVNFDRRGTTSSMFNAVFAFWNARIQGIARYIQLWKDKPAQMSMIMLMDFAAGILLSRILDWFYGDDKDEEGVDKYDKFSSFLKRGYSVLPIPGTDMMVTIPNPHGFGMFHAAGNIVYDWMTKRKDFVTGMLEMFDSFQNSMLPIDMGSAINREGKLSLAPIMPTMLAPWYSISQNENFAGGLIYKEKFTANQNIANSQLYLKNTNKVIKGFTDGLYKFSGGDLELKYKTYHDKNGNQRKVWADINPAKVEYLIEYYLSGKGQFYNSLFKSIVQPIADGISKTVEAESIGGKTIGQAYKELLTDHPSDIPVLNRFLRKANGDPIQREYYETKTDLESYITELNKYTKLHRGEDMGRMMQAPKYKDALRFSERQKVIENLNEQLYLDLSPETKKSIMDQIRILKKEIINFEPK